MDWSTTKDYLNSFIGIVALILPFIFVPEIKKSKRYKAIFVVAFFLLCWLACDKKSRDEKKEIINENGRIRDSKTIVSISSKLNNISNSYSRDSLKFSEFKRDLLKEYGIKDSSNKPYQINNNTHIDKAATVNIGTH